jgi:hypothetical protein
MPFSLPLTPQSNAPPPQSWINVPQSDNSLRATPQYQTANPAPFSEQELTDFSDSNEELFHSFRTTMAPHFPFIVIPPGTNAQNFRSSKPFLFESIILASSYRDVQRQQQLRSENLRSMTDRLFVRGEKSLDLMQGMLVFAVWYQHQLTQPPQFTNVVHLAVALMYDLGLCRDAPRTTERHETLEDAIKSLNHKILKHPRTLEERRAFLGLWYVTNWSVNLPNQPKKQQLMTYPPPSTSSSFKKIGSLPRTSYVEECCQLLEQQQEYHSDEQLVHLIRLQCIIEDAVDARTHLCQGDPLQGLNDMRLGIYVKSLKGNLDKFKSSLPAELNQSSESRSSTPAHHPPTNTSTPVVFQTCLDSAAIHIHESAFHGVSHPRTPSLSRLALLSDCLQATSRFYTTYLSIPAAQYPIVPMTIFSHARHAGVVLSKLNLFSFPGWDLDVVQSATPFANFSETLDKMSVKFEEASMTLDDKGEWRKDDAFVSGRVCLSCFHLPIIRRQR